MLSHSPLNTVASPGPPRLPLNNQNSRNQMHSPAPPPPQMPNGNYGMPMNNYGNQMGMPNQGPMRGGPQMLSDDMIPGPGGFSGGNFGPSSQQGMHMPPQSNQNPFSPMSNGQSGIMNMNPHANMMSPHQQPGNGGGPGPGPIMMSPHGQPGSGPGMMPMYSQPGPGMMSPHPQQNSNIMSPYPQSVMSPHPQQPPGGQGPPPNGSGLMQPHPQSGHNMMPHPNSRVMSPHQGNGHGIHHHNASNIPNNMLPPHMQPNSGPPGMMPPGGNRIIPQHLHPGMPHQMQSPQNIPSPHPHAGMMSPHGPPPPGMIGPHGQSGMPPHSMMGPPIPPGGAKIYPSNQPMIFNSQNPNAPPIHPCGVCHREVQGDSEDGILCESGCNFWFHRMCINMSTEAYTLLKNEIFVEWACDNCIRTKNVPPVKLRS